MPWIMDVALYLIIWWLTLFAVLPWGVKPAREEDQGHDAGAPAAPRLLLKAGVTTLVAALVWAAAHYGLLYEFDKLRNS